MRRRWRPPRLAAEVNIVHRSRARDFLVLGLFLALGSACKKDDKPAEKCSTQTKCSAGFKCEQANGSPVSGPLDVGECLPDPCAVTVPCEKPQHSTHPQTPCINELIEACDMHDPNHFCKCVSTTNNNANVTTGNTPTTG